MEQTTLIPPYTYFFVDGDSYIAFTDEVGDLSGWDDPSNPTFYLNEKDYLYHNSSHERGFVQSANIGTVITVCNILTNLVLVGLVLWDKATRSQFVFQQVLNLALSDLAYSVIVDPFTVYFELQPWKLATWFCVAWMVLDSAFPFVSLLVLIALNADRLLFALSPSLYHRTFRHVTLRGLMLLAPWLVGMGVILPLWLLTATHWPYPGVCMYGIATRAALASAIVSLYVPALGIIVLTVFMLVTIIGGMPQDLVEMIPLRGPHHPPPPPPPPPTARRNPVPPSSFRSESMSQDEDHGEVGGMSGVHGGADKVTVKRCHRALVVALCVTNLVTVITQLPYGAISMLKPNCVESDCQSTVKLMQALVWVRSALFTLRPLCLLLFTHLRRTCCSRRGISGHTLSPAQRGTGHSGHMTSERVEVTSLNTSIISPSRASATMV